MNYQEPLHTSNIDFSKIVYPKSRANQNKKIVLVKYNEKGKLKNFVFQTPTLLNLSILMKIIKLLIFKRLLENLMIIQMGQLK